MPKSISASLKLTTQEAAQFFQNKKTEILQRLRELKTKTEDTAVLALFEKHEQSLQAANISGMNFDNFRLLLGLVQKQMQEWRSNPAVTKTVNVELSDSINTLIRFVGVIGDDLTLMKLVPENTAWVSKDVISLFNFLARETSLAPQEVQRHMNDIFWTKDNELLWQEIKDDLEQEIPDLEERRKFISQLWMKGYFWSPDQPVTHEDFLAKKTVLLWFNKFAQGCLSEWLKVHASAKEILNDSDFPSFLTSEVLAKQEKRKNLKILKKLKPQEFFDVLKQTHLSKNDVSTIRAAIASASQSVGFVEFYGDPEQGLSRRAEVEKYFNTNNLRERFLKRFLSKDSALGDLLNNLEVFGWVIQMAPQLIEGVEAVEAVGEKKYETTIRVPKKKLFGATEFQKKSIEAVMPEVKAVIAVPGLLETQGVNLVTLDKLREILNSPNIMMFSEKTSLSLRFLMNYLYSTKQITEEFFLNDEITRGFVTYLMASDREKFVSDYLAQEFVDLSKIDTNVLFNRYFEFDWLNKVASDSVGKWLYLLMSQKNKKEYEGLLSAIITTPTLRCFLNPLQLVELLNASDNRDSHSKALISTKANELTKGEWLALVHLQNLGKTDQATAEYVLTNYRAVCTENVIQQLEFVINPPKPPKAMTALRLATPEQIRDPKYSLNDLDITTILEKYFAEKSIETTVHAPIVWKNVKQIEDILRELSLCDKPFVMPIKMKDGSWFGLAIIPHPSLPNRYTIRILNPLGNVLSTNLGANSDDIHLETHAKSLLQKDGSSFLKEVVLPIVQAIGKVSYEHGDFNVVTVMHKPQDNVDPKNPVFTMGNLMAVVNGGNKNITRLDPTLVNDVNLRATYAELIAPKIKASVVPIPLVPPADSAPLPPAEGWYSPEIMQNILYAETGAIVQPLSWHLPMPGLPFQSAFADIVEKAFLDSQYIPRVIPINSSNEEDKPYWVGFALYRFDDVNFVMVLCDSADKQQEFRELSSELVSTAKILASNNSIALSGPYLMSENLVAADNLVDHGPFVVEMLRRVLAGVNGDEAYSSVYELRVKHGQHLPQKIQVEIKVEKYEVEVLKEEEQQQEKIQEQEEIIEEVKIESDKSDEVVVVEVPLPPPAPVQEAVLVVEENKPTALQAALLSQAGLLKKPVEKPDEKKVVGASGEERLADVLERAFAQRRVSIYQGGDDNNDDESEDDDWSSEPSSPRKNC